MPFAGKWMELVHSIKGINQTQTDKYHIIS